MYARIKELNVRHVKFSISIRDGLKWQKSHLYIMERYHTVGSITVTGKLWFFVLVQHCIIENHFTLPYHPTVDAIQKLGKVDPMCFIITLIYLLEDLMQTECFEI
jgi:hypothetical protein